MGSPSWPSPQTSSPTAGNLEDAEWWMYCRLYQMVLVHQQSFLVIIIPLPFKLKPIYLHTSILVGKMPGIISQPFKTLTVNELHPTFGAEVSGIDFTQPIPDGQFQDILAAMAKVGSSRSILHERKLMPSHSMASASFATQASMTLRMWNSRGDWETWTTSGPT